MSLNVHVNKTPDTDYYLQTLQHAERLIKRYKYSKRILLYIVEETLTIKLPSLCAVHSVALAGK